MCQLQFGIWPARQATNWHLWKKKYSWAFPYFSRQHKGETWENTHRICSEAFDNAMEQTPEQAQGLEIQRCHLVCLQEAESWLLMVCYGGEAREESGSVPDCVHPTFLLPVSDFLTGTFSSQEDAWFRRAGVYSEHSQPSLGWLRHDSSVQMCLQHLSTRLLLVAETTLVSEKYLAQSMPSWRPGLHLFLE